MLKLQALKATLSAAVLVASIPQIVFSRPLSEISGYPVMPNSQVHSLVCYMETQEGQTLNLGRLCGEVPLVDNGTSGVTTLGLTSGSRGLSGSLPGVGSSGGGEVPLVNNATSGVATPGLTSSTISSSDANTTADGTATLGLTSGSSGLSGSLSGVSSSGNCDYSWQTDSAGRICGDRAASVRSGGSSVSTGSYSSGNSSSGSTYVRGYTRSNGTSVRGHFRRR